MPDPIDELENFSIPGPPMTPLPAAEVRRRGTRIRRRNNALATVGALAVVAAIAVPVTVFAGNQDTSNPAPIDPAGQVEWVQEIPTGFPLTDQMPPSTTERDGYEQQAVDVCDGQGWATDGATDVQQAIYTGETEGGADRTLALYPTGADAEQALAELHTRVLDCATETAGAKQRWAEVIPSAIGDESVTYANHFTDGGDMHVFQLVRVGNAILQDTTYAMGGGDPQVVRQTADLLEEKSADVVDAMCTFSETGC